MKKYKVQDKKSKSKIMSMILIAVCICSILSITFASDREDDLICPHSIAMPIEL